VDRLDAKYNEAIREKADAFMKTLAISIVEQDLKEHVPQDTAMFSPSLAFKERMDRLIKNAERRDRKVRWRKRLNTCGKVVATIVIVGVLICGLLTATVDAFQFKVFEFLNIEHKTHTEIKPMQSDGEGEIPIDRFPPNWAGVFYPGYLPEGYGLLEALDAGMLKRLTFSKADGDHFSLSIVSAADSISGVDNEGVKALKISIDGQSGYLWEKEGTCLIKWISKEQQLDLYTVSLSREEMLKIAESIRYYKLNK
jgi:hypothetical protein